MRIHRHLLAALIVLTVAVSARCADFTIVLHDQHGAAVGDAVVWLLPLDSAVPAPGRLPDATIVQQHAEFIPYVTVVRRGTRINFPNRDQVEHHVYSLSPAKRFEIPLYGGDQSYSETFDKAGIVTLGCNIHDWMLAYVVVVDTPWYALVGSTGQASIQHLPEGRYRLEVWQPRLPGTLSELLIINEGGTERTLSLSLRPDRRIRRSFEGGVEGYR